MPQHFIGHKPHKRPWETKIYKKSRKRRNALDRLNTVEIGAEERHVEIVRFVVVHFCLTKMEFRLNKSAAAAVALAEVVAVVAV